MPRFAMVGMGQGDLISPATGSAMSISSTDKGWPNVRQTTARVFILLPRAVFLSPNRQRALALAIVQAKDYGSKPSFYLWMCRSMRSIATAELPPLAWLRAFEASARHGSFTAASGELNLTQAAVSHQVRSLEKFLGVALFERLARNLRLTEMGAAYLPPLRKSFDELSAATVGLFGGGGRKVLTVRAPVSFSSLWLAPRIAGFCDAFPHIEVRIISAVWTDADVADRADADIRFGAGQWPGFRAEMIDRSPAIVVCPRAWAEDLEGLGGANARLEWLAGRRLIHLAGADDPWHTLFGRGGLPIPPQGLSVDTSVAALELATSGYGAALILSCFTERYVGEGHLIAVEDFQVAPEHGHFVVVPDGPHREKPEAILFRRWLAQANVKKGPVTKFPDYEPASA